MSLFNKGKKETPKEEVKELPKIDAPAFKKEASDYLNQLNIFELILNNQISLNKTIESQMDEIIKMRQDIVELTNLIEREIKG